MSAFADIKQNFLSDAVTHGWTERGMVRGYDNVPEHLLARWCRQLTAPEMPPLNGRYVNHFLVGADPEFMMTLPKTGESYHAETARLRQGLAFGEDNSGRQVELRPVPSRSALAVTASLWSTLKWFNALCPAAHDTNWISGPYWERDGLGGHIHFGRQRPTQEREILALDTLAYRLFSIGMFDRDAARHRLEHTNYGRLGDVRRQSYGYEYRTFPSFLESPAQAFLTLTLAKLAVVRPEFFPVLTEATEQERPALHERQLSLILAYFRGLDDDAAMAFEVLRRSGWPRTHLPFAGKWGITGVVTNPHKIGIIPREIPPTEREIELVREHLLIGRPLPNALATPTWNHQLPQGYMHALAYTSTRHAPGFGEFLSDLVVHSNVRIGFAYVNGIPMISTELDGVMPKGWNSRLEGWAVRGREGYVIDLPSGMLTTPADAAKLRTELVDSGLFPVWAASKVTADSYALWRHQKLAPPKGKRDSIVVVNS